MEEFLLCLGDKIALQGWDKYKGGLDVRNNTTGTHAVYTTFHALQIVFHVAPFIPFTDGDVQQVERKRHIGNDIVVIVFRESGAPPFDPSVIKSHFNMVFLVVTPVKARSGTTHYHVALASNDSIKAFGPALCDPPIYRKDARFREMVLAKLINAERAAYASPTFAQKFKRTRRELLEMIARDFASKSGSSFSGRLGIGRK